MCIRDRVKVDVDAVLPAEIDDAIDLSQRLVIDVRPVGGLAPYPIRQRQARKIEAPLLHQGKIGLFEGCLLYTSRCV